MGVKPEESRHYPVTVVISGGRFRRARQFCQTKLVPFKHTKTLISRARKYRRLGFSQKHIAKLLKVSHRTVAEWVQDIHLSKEQLQKLMSRKGRSTVGERNAAKWRNERERLLQSAKSEFRTTRLTKGSLALSGALLYWAEGTKGRNTFRFSNSDPWLAQVFVKSLDEILLVSRDRISCTVNVHLNNGLTKNDIVEFWAATLRISTKQIQYFNVITRTGSKKKRHVNGIIEIRVPKSISCRAKLAVLLSKCGRKTNFVECAI